MINIPANFHTIKTLRERYHEAVQFLLIRGNEMILDALHLEGCCRLNRLYAVVENCVRRAFSKLDVNSFNSKRRNKRIVGKVEHMES